MGRTVGRNDPCPCGSGKKYKQCCMARDKAAQAERVAWDRAAQDMRAALIGFAKEPEFVQDVAYGLGLFWQDRYTAETVHRMSVDESLRFFDWFAHDYRLQFASAVDDDSPSVVGKRLIEAYRQRVADALGEKEKATLDRWIESLPGSAFVLEAVDTEQGTISIRDLFLPERSLIVHDRAAAGYGEVGQILLARPLPGQQHMYLSGATVVLPAAEGERLRAFLEQAYQAYRQERPASDTQGIGEPDTGTSSDGLMRARFLRDRAHLLTHYALQWAEREGRPPVSAQDPEAHKPGGDSVRKLIRWGQERVRVR